MDEKTLSMFGVFTGFSEHKCFVEVDHLVGIVVCMWVCVCVSRLAIKKERERKKRRWGETGETADKERLKIKRELDQETVR